MNATGVFRVLAATIASISDGASAAPAEAPDAKAPVKVFILAGDENALEQGAVEGRTAGSDVEFYPGATPVRDERVKHVTFAVYKGAYVPGTDYDTLTPDATGTVEVGDQRTQRRPDNKRGLDKENGKISTPIDVYEKNLANLIRDLRRKTDRSEVGQVARRQIFQ